MKQLKTTKSLAVLLLAASATSLTAIERPTPADQPKEKKAEAVKPKENLLPIPMAQAPKQEQRAYLGVMGNRTTEAMAAQLNLKQGVGLTLLFVEENSPAGKAGLKRHDIITKIGEVDVGNQDQLRKAILKHEPNAKVELSYISAGEAKTKQIELGSAPAIDQALPQDLRDEGEMPKLKNQGLPQGVIPLEMLQNLPPEQRKQLQQLLEGNLNQLDFRNLKNLDIDQLQKHFEGFQKMPQMELNMGELMNEGIKQKQRMKMVDPDGSVTLETEDDKKSIELRDTEGKLLYKGPFNNQADKLKIPENLRDRANKLQMKEMPKVQILPGLENLKDLKGLEDLKNLKLPNEIGDLLKQLEGQVQGLALPEGVKPKNGNLMQKFEFNLGAGGGLNQNSSKSLMDAKGNRYTSKESKDGKEIEIQDSNGKLLYSGPYNSSTDKEMVPEEYRPSLQRLDQLGGFKELKLELAPPK